MPYYRKELHFINNFDFSIISGKPKAKSSSKPQPKFIIVLNVENHDKGLYCLITSMRGLVTSTIAPKLTKECNDIDDGHYFKFLELGVCDNYDFDVDSFITAHPSDLFEESIATLHQMFGKHGNSRKIGMIKDEIFISILECLKQSDYISGEQVKKIEKVLNEETAILKAKNEVKLQVDEDSKKQKAVKIRPKKS